jgi:hypothetical protein
MHHDLKQSAKKISNNAQLIVLHGDRPVDNPVMLQDRMHTFMKLFNDLDKEFSDFISFS